MFPGLLQHPHLYNLKDSVDIKLLLLLKLKLQHKSLDTKQVISKHLLFLFLQMLVFAHCPFMSENKGKR